MKSWPLHVQIIFGLLLGVVWALFSSWMGWSAFTQDWIAPFGDIFIQVLKLIAIPLVLFSIIKGVAGLPNANQLGRLGGKTLVLYLLSTVFSVTIGLLLVNSIQPGERIGIDQRKANHEQYSNWKAGVTETGDQPSHLSGKIAQAKETKSQGPLQFLKDMVPSNIFQSLNDNKAMLQIIFFAIFFGITLLAIPKAQAAPVLSVIDGFNAVFLKMVDTTMRAAPFFVFALLAGKISELAGDDVGAVAEVFKGLGWYSLTVVAGLAVMAFIVYPTMVRLLGGGIRYQPFFRGIGPAQMLAFSTSSSAATLPVTMECVQDKLGVSKETASFVLPIGATVNMDGTSLYQAVAVVFLAQFHMIDLSLAQQLTIVMTATLASIGSAAVPSAGLVMLIIVLEAVGLNPAWIAIIFPVDRILDMCRTVVNVTGDATVACIVGNETKKS